MTFTSGNLYGKLQTVQSQDWQKYGSKSQINCFQIVPKNCICLCSKLLLQQTSDTLNEWHVQEAPRSSVVEHYGTMVGIICAFLGFTKDHFLGQTTPFLRLLKLLHEALASCLLKVYSQTMFLIPAGIFLATNSKAYSPEKCFLLLLF